MRQESSFDVVVIGSGITGLSTVKHLLDLGVRRLALCSHPEIGPVSDLAAGCISGGQVDNFTRISHRHGVATATALWRFGDQAFDDLRSYCQARQVRHLIKPRLRLLVSEPERKEAQLAVASLNQQGFRDVALVSPPSSLRLGPEVLPRVLAVQKDGPRGGWVDTQMLLGRLADDTANVPKFGPAQRISDRGQNLTIHCPALSDYSKEAGGGMDGANAEHRLNTELVVVAAHLATSQLVPVLADALVSVADQWSEVRFSAETSALAGIYYSTNHTYEWGVFTSPNTVRLGGGRYLRPMAGIEAKEAAIDQRIIRHLLQQFGKTFRASADEVMLTQAALDIRPCDEIPVVGPLFGDGRVLVATGFMGAGVTLGFLAGRCLAELIAKGSTPTLPRELWPERLRSLES